jgi:hypothetical protein
MHSPALESSIPGWAFSISQGPADEVEQTLTFDVSFTETKDESDSPNLFTPTGRPMVDATGNLTFTPMPNARGIAHVTVTLSDGAGGVSQQQFTIRINKPLIGHNSNPTFAPIQNGLDVADPNFGKPDNSIDPGDALAVINFINSFGSHELNASNANDVGPPYVDVNADNYVAPDDALTIINYINSFNSGSTLEAPNFEGERIATLDQFFANVDSVADAASRPMPAVSTATDDLMILLAFDHSVVHRRRR